MSAMRNSDWFKVVMSKHGQNKVKDVQPPAFKPTASLPVVSPVVPATKALPALSLLGMLGLLLVSAPMDGNCYLHCAVCILKKVDSKKHAATTHDSLRAEMCVELLRNRCRVGTKSFISIFTTSSFGFCNLFEFVPSCEINNNTKSAQRASILCKAY